MHGRKFKPARDDIDEFFLVVGDAAAAAAERETRAYDGRIANLGLRDERVIEIAYDFGLRTFQADVDHRATEQLAVFRHANRFARCADQFYTVFFENSVFGEIERAVERGLATHRRQQRIRFFFRDDALDRVPVDRLDVDRVGHFRIGHDRGRIRVHQHDAITFLLERLACLRARVIEFARLPDDDRAGADDEDGF